MNFLIHHRYYSAAEYSQKISYLTFSEIEFFSHEKQKSIFRELPTKIGYKNDDNKHEPAVFNLPFRFDLPTSIMHVTHI
jgi:hypothetical protein